MSAPLIAAKSASNAKQSAALSTSQTPLPSPRPLLWEVLPLKTQFKSGLKTRRKNSWKESNSSPRTRGVTALWDNKACWGHALHWLLEACPKSVAGGVSSVGCWGRVLHRMLGACPPSHPPGTFAAGWRRSGCRDAVLTWDAITADERHVYLRRAAAADGGWANQGAAEDFC